MSKACNKIKHTSRRNALTAMLSLSRKRGASSVVMQVYRCKECKIKVPGGMQRAWHVGHDSGRMRRVRGNT